MSFCSKFIQETVYQILSEWPKFYRRYYKKHYGLFISGYTAFSLALCVSGLVKISKSNHAQTTFCYQSIAVLCSGSQC